MIIRARLKRINGDEIWVTIEAIVPAISKDEVLYNYKDQTIWTSPVDGTYQEINAYYEEA